MALASPTALQTMHAAGGDIFRAPPPEEIVSASSTLLGERLLQASCSALPAHTEAGEAVPGVSGAVSRTSTGAALDGSDQRALRGSTSRAVTRMPEWPHVAILRGVPKFYDQASDSHSSFIQVSDLLPALSRHAGKSQNHLMLPVFWHPTHCSTSSPRLHFTSYIGLQA